MGESDREPGSARSERLGPYTLLEPLGEGGMAAVHRAVHVPTGAVHAVKVVRPQTPEEALRFLREAEGMARVEGHSHVLRVHAAGQEHGRLWLAMELAPGGSLEQRLAGGPLPIDDLAPLGRALALGLAHIHARGVLHRDLKPANILFDAGGQPKLADFGVARLRGAQALTRTGALVGTPAYMAPEQALAAGGVDERVDVYGLGAVLYHAATGEAPFAAASTLAMLEAVIKKAPADPRRLRPELPAWLARELLRALSKSPDDRHASATALAAALAGPPPSRRSRAPLVAAGALGVVVLGLAVARGLPPPAAETPRPSSPAVVHSARPPAADLERFLDDGEPQRALDAATGVPGDQARWVRFRALLELGRTSEAAALAPPRERRELARALLTLEASRADLERLDRLLTAVRATGEGLEPDTSDGPAPELRMENPYMSLGRVLHGLRTLEPPLALLREQAGTTGQALLERLVSLLAGLFPELLRLVRNEGGPVEGGDVEAVVETLQSVIAVVRDTRERRALATVAIWLRVVTRTPEARSPADLAALARAATDPGLDPRFQRLAALASIDVGLKDGDTLDRLVEMDERLGPTPDRRDPLVDAFRRAGNDLADGLLRAAWSDRARRRAILTRLEGVLSRIPESSYHDAQGRQRLLAGLLSGREPSQVDVASLRQGTPYRLILDGEVLLGRGLWAEAAQRFRDAQGLVSSSNLLVDPWTGLALAQTLAGDPEAGAATLAAVAGRANAYAWLPWRDVTESRAAITMARAGTWAPSPGHPFPPD